MIEFTQASSPRDFEKISTLAKDIWKEHYSSILKDEQIEYMIKHFQSFQAIQSQALEGYAYYLIYENKNLAGYFSIMYKNDSVCNKNKSIEELFLSKLYLHQNHRQKGIAKQVISHLKDMAKNSQNIKKIWLTVNKNNINSIKAYEKMGFTTYREDVVDIGEGYVMDDYYMSLELK